MMEDRRVKNIRAPDLTFPYSNPYAGKDDKSTKYFTSIRKKANHNAEWERSYGKGTHDSQTFANQELWKGKGHRRRYNANLYTNEDQGSMEYPRPFACCKADDKVRYVDPEDGAVLYGCPEEWRLFAQAFETKFTGKMADKVMGCAEGHPIDKKTGRCRGKSAQGFDTPTGIQVYTESMAALF